jgi:hypothetical protein
MSIELPSLPVPDGTTDVDTGPVFHQGQYLGRTIREEDAWSKSLVLAYGQQCRKAALLEAAELCEQIESDIWKKYKDSASRSQYDEGRSDGAGECAYALSAKVKEQE